LPKAYRKEPIKSKRKKGGLLSYHLVHCSTNTMPPVLLGGGGGDSDATFSKTSRISKGFQRSKQGLKMYFSKQ
jgi:hypothetical protein